MSQGPFPVLAEISAQASATSDTLEKVLQRYFNVQRKSGGGDCQVSRLTNTTFRVSFDARKAQQKVLERKEHDVIVNSATFTVTVRSIEQTQESRDASGDRSADNGAAEGAILKRRGSEKGGAHSERRDSSEESGEFKKVVMVDPYFGEYLKERSDVQRAFHQELVGAQCEVQLGAVSDTILLVPTFSRNIPGEASTEWGDEARRAFKKVLRRYLVHTETHPAKGQLLMEQSKLAPKSVSIFSPTPQSLTIVVGLSEEVRRFIGLIEPFAGQVEPAEDTQSEAKLRSLSKFSLIRDSFEEHLKTRSPRVTWTLDESRSSISFAGRPDAVRDAATELHGRLSQVSEATVRLSDQETAFLGLWTPQEMAKELFPFPVAMEVAGRQVVLFGNSPLDLKRAETILTEKISEEVIEVPDVARVATAAKEWQPFLSNSSKRVQVIEVKGRDGDTASINLAGFSKDVKRLASALRECLHNSAVVAETIVPHTQELVLLIRNLMEFMGWQGFQSEISTRGRQAIVLTGPRSVVAGEKVRLESCLASVTCESLTVPLPGAKEFFQGSGKEHLDAVGRKSKCLVVLKEDPPAGETGGDQLASPGSVVLSTYCSEGGVVISICRGDITKQQVDAIVNAANGRLNHSGGVARAISKAGGPEIDRESSAYVAAHGNVQVGQAVMTDAGRLPCKKVIHAVGPRWSGSHSEESQVKDLLRSSVSESLQLAEKHNLQSIAIPCLSSGIFGVPKALCANAIVTAIKESDTRSLRRITLIDIDEDVLSELQRACGRLWTPPSRRSPCDSSVRPPSLSPDPGPPATTQLEIISGPIEEEATDVLVAPVTHAWDLHSTAVSRAIIAKSLTLKWPFKTCQSTNPAIVKKVDVSDDRSLKCKYIYFVVCNRWTELKDQAEKSLRRGIRTCLEDCHKASLSSITFPFVGAGKVMAFPKEVAARALLGEVQRFKDENGPTSIKSVRIAVHPANKSGEAMLREIQQCHQQMRTGMTDGRSQGAFYHSLADSEDIVRMNIGDIVLQVVRGNITKETNDVIVNSTSISPPAQGVSKAIFDASGLRFKDVVCKVDLTSGNVLLTEPGRLRCKAIMHVCGGDDPEMIKKAVKNVLHECHRKGFRSVSFPAIGTGNGRLNPRTVAEVMIEAIASVAQERSPTLVRLVRIVIFQDFIFRIFKASLENRLEAQPSTSILKELVNTVSSWVNQEEPPRLPDRYESDEVSQPAVIDVVGRVKASVTEAVSQLRRVIEANFREEMIAHDCPARLTAGEVDGLLRLSYQHRVHVTVERGQAGGGQVMAWGQAGNVEGALSSVRCVLDEAALREWEELLSAVQWYYNCNGMWLPFDLEANFLMERDHSNKVRRCMVKMQGYTFSVDLDRKEATVRETNDVVKIKRVEVPTGGSLTDNYQDMKGSPVTKVPLTTNSAEYLSVMRKFGERCGPQTIIKIERIHNVCLKRAYQKRKLAMEGRCDAEEKVLYHPTDRDASLSIENYGFHGSCTPVNGYKYGNGMYFTVNPLHSRDAALARRDRDEYRYVYQCRVLVGQYTQGEKGMDAPPPRSGWDPTDLYDSVVDHPSSPSTFVIFRGDQSYPEYLITFK
ncbi:protein mono-ADP-ribosyltransferase PARP14-like isoform X2 [Heptranchias perlo]|uniref:protein mono-ADP-ribosyltransferase PARP14-like isoform X2 n=1 Tax=Heptranchias perlo TaxID=212740 RepID=UPI003559BD4B